METLSTAIACDGCGLPASAGHIAARMDRLELVTRFRPIHIHTLFVALEPMARPEDEFYRPPESREFFDSLLGALDIPPPESNAAESDAARLLEFQRRGYYLAYVSECPVTPQPSADPGVDKDAVQECISRLAPTLIKRIRFNYKPKHVALLGTQLKPLIGIFEQAGLASLLLLDHGTPLTIPRSGDLSSVSLFRRTVLAGTPSAPTSAGV